jgi:Tfp pilus assembly protein PilX
MTSPSTSPRKRQRGATLIIAMVILVLIMQLGIAAMLASDTQLRLSGNLQFEDVALNRAEAAIATAESWLSTHDQDAGFVDHNPATPWLHPIGHLRSMAAPDNNATTLRWSDGNSLSLVPGDDTQRYFIERISWHAQAQGYSLGVGDRSHTACNAVNTYLITARGTAARGATKLIQSYYAVLAC